MNRMRTVQMNERGQIVIPEEIRDDLKLRPGEALVLIESVEGIIVKKESSVVDELVDSVHEKRFWKAMSLKSMERAWSKEDEVWEKYYRPEVKKT